jgi:hypothetical protein
MISTRRLAVNPLIAFLLCLSLGGTTLADNRYFDESSWRECRAAKRHQVGDLCDTWFATWRSGAVGKTYLVLADHYERIDLSRCSPALSKHVKKSVRICTEIAELFGQGTMPDIEAVFLTVKRAGGIKSSSSVTSERGRRVLELMRELSASEEAMIKELKLDE